jgi:hypothetical protein
VVASDALEVQRLVWLCLVLSVDRCSVLCQIQGNPFVVAPFLHDRAVPDSPQRCVIVIPIH